INIKGAISAICIAWRASCEWLPALLRGPKTGAGEVRCLDFRQPQTRADGFLGASALDNGVPMLHVGFPVGMSEVIFDHFVAEVADLRAHKVHAEFQFRVV